MIVPVLLLAMLAASFAGGTGALQQAQQKSAPAPTTPDDFIPPAPQMEPLPAVSPGARVLQSHPTNSLPPASAFAKEAVLDRSSVTFTAWDLELLIRPLTGTLAARGHITLRNDATTTRTAIPLQISSALQWQAVTMGGAKMPFAVHTLDTDLDHTGVANEAVITLPQPLAAGASLTLDVLYEGAVPLDATRIEHLGAPRDMAQHTDWDRIAGDFTGLRGFGTVLWYPVAAEPVSLGDGAKIFHVIGAWKQRQQAATMRLRIRVDTTSELDAPAHTAGDPVVQARTVPTVALLNGEKFKLESSTLADTPAIVEAELPVTTVGFAIPSIFLLSREEIASNGLRMFPRDADVNAAAGFVTAAEQVRPLVSQWLGPQKRDLLIADTPALQDAAYETQAAATAARGAGSVLVTPMLAQNPQQNTLAMAHALSHASFVSGRGWLSEGVAQFVTSLWVGNAQPGRTGDPAAALAALEDQRPALALAEPGDANADAGEPLISAGDDILLRTKAAYVLWMLREMTSDEALAHALTAYSAQADREPQYFQRLLEASSHKDLQWFFDDWVYRDRGLPDLRIVNVISHKMDTTAPSWLVSVDIANQGYCAAEVPVTMSAGDAMDTQRVRVPARGTVTARAILHSQPTNVRVNDGATPEGNVSIHDHAMEAVR